ncbi:MAG: twin-arginine translocase subunit TatC [bacterium]
MVEKTAIGETIEESNEKNKKMTFLEHLEELRGRLIRIAIAIIIGSIVSYFKIDILMSILLKPAGGPLIFISPFEAFIVQLKVSLISGVIITLPYTLFELWGFISPALHRREKRFLIPFILSSLFLFSLGIYFAYILLPIAMSFFRSFESDMLKATWTISKYMDFLIKMFLGFGFVFETPIIVLFLARFGIVSPEFLIKKWRIIVISIFIIAAFITPGPDIFSQIVLVIPLILLYIISIFVAKIAYKKQNESK